MLGTIMLAALTITPAQGGYGFSGQTMQIDVQQAVATEAAPTRLQWTLTVGDTKLASDAVALPAGLPAKVTLELPAVKSRSQLAWRCEVYADGGKEPLADGEATLHVFPEVLTTELAKFLKDRRMTVIDDDEALVQRLAKLGVDAGRVSSPDALALRRADLVVLAYPDSPKATQWSSVVLGKAEGGTGVLVMGAAAREHVLDYALQPRATDQWLRWRVDHPMLSGLTESDLAAWAGGVPAPLQTVALPLDEPSLEIAYWEPDWKSAEPRPLDALIVEKRVGHGRVIVCQLPLADWERDPRAATVLAKTLEYLTTRPIPTPSPRDRRPAPERTPESQNEIKLTPGARP